PQCGNRRPSWSLPCIRSEFQRAESQLSGQRTRTDVGRLRACRRRDGRGRSAISSNHREEEMATEEYKIDGQHLLSRVKEIVHEGNVRRIIIKNEQGHSLIEIPLSIGVVGAVLMPVWV